MKRINLTITAQAPLAIGQRKPGGSVSEAMDYIPGTVIRGAIAGKLLQQGTPETGDDFHRLFVDEGAAIFQNAYPAIAKVWNDVEEKYDYQLSPEKTRVLPATALSSKTESGFKRSPGDKKRGVFDALIDSYCAKEHGFFYEPNSKRGDRVEPFGGFYSRVNGSYFSHAVSKRLLTRVGINRRRATAQDEILYSLEVLNESQGKEKRQPTIYRSTILVDDTLADALSTFINQNPDRFRLGGSASRGLGQVEINVAQDDVLASTQTVKDRIDAFNDCLRQRWQQWGPFGNRTQSIEGKTFFSIGLESEAILVDNWRRIFVFSAKLLKPLIAVETELEMAYSSYGYRSGWNAAWGLAKDIELVTTMGSVFLFSMPTSDENGWLEKLAKLELTGIGNRTSEGFGQIRVCDEFHQVMREAPV
ncbi:MAG: CRISPR-associated RAMP protein Csx10 [Cyanobacteria bacterium P01_C01_bin.120]